MEDTNAIGHFRAGIRLRLTLVSAALTFNHMRLLAWLAVFSLQLGMFVCGAGIDVCHAAESVSVNSAASLLPDMPADDDADAAPSDQVCTAHAAHVFLGAVAIAEMQALLHMDVTTFPAALQLPEYDHLIEQPPKFAHS